MTPRLASALVPLAAAVTLAPAPPAAATPRCARPGHSYGGLVAEQPVHGIVASVTALSTPVVESGHVAGWVGVAGAGIGAPAEWLQVGLNSHSGTENRLYYEYAVPGQPVHYVELDAHVPAGRTVRVAVLQARGERAWGVWVDGRSAGRPIVLSSHDGLWAIAASENWDGGQEGCNRFAYRFERLALAMTPGGGWRPFARGVLLQDQGYRVLRAESSVTVALGVELDSRDRPAVQLSR